MQESHPARLGFPGEQCSVPASQVFPQFPGLGLRGSEENAGTQMTRGKKAKGRRKHVQSAGSGVWRSSEGLSDKHGFDLPFLLGFYACLQPRRAPCPRLNR